MKSQIKLLGIDDGPFNHSDPSTVLIGTIMRANGYLEAILKREIIIDGDEATDIVIEMIQHTRHKTQLKAALLDGVAVGGFNIVDIQKVYNETKLPVITVTRDYPNFKKIQNALQTHFSDWKKRFEIIQNGTLHSVQTSYNPIYIKCVGIAIDKAKEIITLSTIRGVIPEPVRIAHMIASGMIRGESYGKT